MPNDEPGLPRNAYASEGFNMVGFLWKPEAALQISEGREQVMKSDWGRGGCRFRVKPPLIPG
jgi:hypothetical protein